MKKIVLVTIFPLSVIWSVSAQNYADSAKKYREILDYEYQYGDILKQGHLINKVHYYEALVSAHKSDSARIKAYLENKYKIKLK